MLIINQLIRARVSSLKKKKAMVGEGVGGNRLKDEILPNVLVQLQ